MRKATPPRPNAAWLPVAPDSPWTLIPCCSGRRVRPLTDTAKRAPPPRPRGGGKGRPLELTAAGDCALQLALAHLRAALDSKALRLAVELLLGELGGHPSPFRLGPGAASRARVSGLWMGARFPPRRFPNLGPAEPDAKGL